MLSAGTVEMHHGYRIIGPDGAAPIEGEVLVTAAGTDPDAPRVAAVASGA
jgi:hypothetical protein